MKKLILTSILTITTICAFSQTKLDVAQFKSYKSCPSCFDNWKKDNDDLTKLKTSLNTPAQNTKRQMSNGVKKTLGFLISSTIAVAGIVAYDKIYNGINNISQQ